MFIGLRRHSKYLIGLSLFRVSLQGFLLDLFALLLLKLVNHRREHVDPTEFRGTGFLGVKHLHLPAIDGRQLGVLLDNKSHLSLAIGVLLVSRKRTGAHIHRGFPFYCSCWVY